MCFIDRLSIHSGGTMKIYGCYFYNMDLTHWFDTEAEAKAYGERSGFQFIVVERDEQSVGYN